MNCGGVSAYKSYLCRTNKQLVSCFFFPSLSAPSFYPGYAGIPSILDPEARQFLNTSIDDLRVDDEENEEDWIDDRVTRLTQGQPAKMSEAMAIEVRLCCPTIFLTLQPPSQRPSWKEPDAMIGLPSPASVTRARENPGHNIHTSPPHDSGATATSQLVTGSVALTDMASGKQLCRSPCSHC